MSLCEPRAAGKSSTMIVLLGMGGTGKRTGWMIVMIVMRRRELVGRL